MKESMKVLTKVNNTKKEAKMQALKRKLDIIEKFVAAKKLLVSAPDQVLPVIQALLETPDLVFSN